MRHAHLCLSFSERIRSREGEKGRERNVSHAPLVAAAYTHERERHTHKSAIFPQLTFLSLEVCTHSSHTGFTHMSPVFFKRHTRVQVESATKSIGTIYQAQYRKPREEKKRRRSSQPAMRERILSF